MAKCFPNILKESHTLSHPFWKTLPFSLRKQMDLSGEFTQTKDKACINSQKSVSRITQESGYWHNCGNKQLKVSLAAAGIIFMIPHPTPKIWNSLIRMLDGSFPFLILVLLNLNLPEKKPQTFTQFTMGYIYDPYKQHFSCHISIKMTKMLAIVPKSPD